MKRIVWTEPAKADVRRLAFDTGISILNLPPGRPASTLQGDVNRLKAEGRVIRLCVGNYMRLVSRLFIIKVAAE